MKQRLESQERAWSQLELIHRRMPEVHQSLDELLHWFNAVFAHCPLPAWVKDSRNVMLAMNPAYNEIYGKPQSDYIGCGDSSSWPKDEAENYTATDEMASRDGYAVRHEPIENEQAKRREALDVVKWVSYLADGTELRWGMVKGNTPLPVSALLDG